MPTEIASKQEFDDMDLQQQLHTLSLLGRGNTPHSRLMEYGFKDREAVRQAIKNLLGTKGSAQ